MCYTATRALLQGVEVTIVELNLMMDTWDIHFN